MRLFSHTHVTLELEVLTWREKEEGEREVERDPHSPRMSWWEVVRVLEIPNNQVRKRCVESCVGPVGHLHFLPTAIFNHHVSMHFFLQVLTTHTPLAHTFSLGMYGRQ